VSSARPWRAIVGISVEGDNEVARRTTTCTEASESCTDYEDRSNILHVEETEDDEIMLLV
jgi:hypothetical protein